LIFIRHLMAVWVIRYTVNPPTPTTTWIQHSLQSIQQASHAFHIGAQSSACPG
jgi:hypothetical protein